jgi:hypothetical protein
MMKLLGHHLTCDDAVCLDCWNPGDPNAEPWLGFEDWKEPIPILADQERDTPSNCVNCEHLLPHSLTDMGRSYVREAVETGLDNPWLGRPCILKGWANEYLDEGSVGSEGWARVQSWPDQDDLSPTGLETDS